MAFIPSPLHSRDKTAWPDSGLTSRPAMLPRTSQPTVKGRAMTKKADTRPATAHTPEPWMVVGQEYDNVRIETEHPMPTQDHAYGDQTIVGSSEWTFLRDFDTRRICAAVNACKGITTEALENGAVTELLAISMKFSEALRTNYSDAQLCLEERDAWRDAIEKATGRAA
jgi:hypothetical protein